jgi:alpha-acetolactate decarboxylase
MRVFSLTLWMAFMGVSVVGCAPTSPGVQQFGAMRPVMREGQTESRIRLTAAVAQPHAIAVGALEGLAGEVTIVDGDVWVSRVVGSDLEVTGPDPIAQDNATLLTLAHVARWQTVPIETTAQGEQVEKLIERTARERGIDTSEPFAFMITGAAPTMNIHVINGYCPVATDPATIDAEPWRWSNAGPTDAVVVGFYAKDAAGVMTHHGTSIHAHAIVSIDGKTMTGHVDEVSVAPGMILRLP